MIAKAGVIEPPLFFYLPSLEQTSHNKLHDIWILRTAKCLKNNKGITAKIAAQEEITSSNSPQRHRWFGFPNKKWLSEAWGTEPGIRVSFLQP